MNPFQSNQFIIMIGHWWHLMLVRDHFLKGWDCNFSGEKKAGESYCAGIFLSRFPLPGERSPGCGCEMRCRSCPLSGAEIYFSTSRLLMASGSVLGAVLLPGAEVCYSVVAFFNRPLNVLAQVLVVCCYSACSRKCWFLKMWNDVLLKKHLLSPERASEKVLITAVLRVYVWMYVCMDGC